MTRQQVAGALVCTPEQVRNVYRNFKAQFVLGEHYFALEGEALRKFKSVEKNRRALGKYASQVMLWTQKGVELLCKLFGTDKAAQVYADLARDYFNLVTVEESDDVKNLVPVVFANQRVLLSRQIAQIYECSEDRIKDNFYANRDQYIAGLHYFVLTGAALDNLRVGNPDLQISPMVRTLYLWTERGAMRRCKSINTPEAWAQFDKLEQCYFSVKGEPKKRKPQSEFARVYGMQMHNNLVKIGCSDDVDGRMPEVERDSGWQVKDEHHTVRMDRRRALREERRLHRKYLGVNVNGEYFNAPFDDVKQDLDAISLTLEEQVVEGISDYARGKLLVELCNSKLDSPFKEQLAKQTANFLFGEKLF